VEERRAIIVGAGVAGLTVARNLALAGYRVTVLEARNRIGGRILTLYPPDSPLRVELGAEFIHGRHPELNALAGQARMLLCEIQGEHRYAMDGQLCRSEAIWDRSSRILSALTAQGEDQTFLGFLRSSFTERQWNQASQLAVSFVEGFNGADASRVSTHWLAKQQVASQRINEDRQFWVVNGYSCLIEWLRGELHNLGVDLFLETIVHTVTWSPGRVAVQADRSGDPVTFEGAVVVLTVPLGVLQLPADQPGGIRFEPDIVRHRNAAGRLEMGSVFRITFLCREAWWERALPSGPDAVPDLGFLHAPAELVPTWWTPYPLQAPLITGWAGGPKANRLLLSSDRDHVNLALDSLSAITGYSRRALDDQVVETYSHNWQQDPFARGAYSYVPVHALDAVETLSESCMDTLFFGGEATDTTGYTGTVHGAVASAVRVTRQVLAAGSA
jgi:monoamine oxidase